MPVRNIVFTGISGIRKRKTIETFRDYVARRDGVPTVEIPQAFPIVDAETGINFEEFLEISTEEQRTTLELAYKNASSAIERARKSAATRAIFLSLHASFMHYDRIFSSLPWFVSGSSTPLLAFLLRSLKPDCFVNLIDDCYYLQDRVRHGAAEINLRLREFVKWREIETVFTDHLANEFARPLPPQSYSFEHSPMVAVRHPCETLYRYLFEPDVPRIYASFLIGEIRKRAVGARKEAMIRQVNVLLEMLSEKFCVFNPLTIDELPLEVSKRRNKKGLVTFKAGDRWEQFPEPTITPFGITGSLKLRLDEIKDITARMDKKGRSIVRRQIAYRDFRLVEQSDCVVIYRPTNKTDAGGRSWGSGCREEFSHAKQMLPRRPSMRIYIIRDKIDRSMDELVPFYYDTFDGHHPHIRLYEYAELDSEHNQRAALSEVIRQIQLDSERLCAPRLTV